MKIFIYLFSTLIISSVFTQEMYGFDRELLSVTYSSDESKIIGFGRTWMEVDGKKRLGSKITVWDTTGSELFSKNLVGLEKIMVDGIEFKGRIQLGKLNPDRTKLYILGVQYQGKGQEIKSVFHVYHIPQDSMETVIADKENQITDFSFHPTEPNKLVLIYMNPLIKSEVGTWDEQNGTLRVKTYSNPTSPLSIAYSKNGRHVIVGYGSTGMTGGIEIFDAFTRKLLKKVAIKDHIIGIQEWNEMYYCEGVNATYIIDCKSFAFKKKIPVSIYSIDDDENNALLKPITNEESKQIRTFDLKTEKVKVLFENTCLYELSYSKDKTKLLGVCCKSEFDQSEENLKGPSAKILVVNE